MEDCLIARSVQKGTALDAGKKSTGNPAPRRAIAMLTDVCVAIVTQRCSFARYIICLFTRVILCYRAKLGDNRSFLGEHRIVAEAQGKTSSG